MRIARKLFSRQSIVTTLLIALIFSIVAPAVAWSRVATEPYATAMHKTVDIFEGSFSSQKVAATPNKAFDVSFSICPTVDALNTIIRFIMPADLVKLAKGCEVWKGDVKKGERMTLQLSFVAEKEVDVNVRADVEASPEGITSTSSYCLEVTTSTENVNPESSEDVPVTARQSSSESVEDLISESPAGTITVKGQWKFIDENGAHVPMRQVVVYLMDDDTGPDEEVAWQYTDYDGKYSFTVNNDDGFLQDGRDPYIKVYSNGGCAYCKTSGGGWYVSSLPKCGNDVNDGFYYDYGSWYTTGNNEAWQSIDACLSERDWVYWRSSPYWQRPTKVDIRWPKEDWPHCHGDSIHLPSKSTWNWNHYVVQHEYAHAIMWALYGHWPSGWGPDPHHVYDESSGGFAMLEGWAEFMQCAVDNNQNNLQGWYGGHGGNIETNDWHNCKDTGDMDGWMVEGSVASVFWDINDPVSTADNDPMYWGFNEIFHVMRYDQPDSILEFWTDWTTRWPTLDTSKGPLSTIYWHYGIDRDYYSPYDGSISINADALYTTSRSVTLTLSCKDWGSGVAYMRFSNDLGAWSGWYAYSTTKSWTLGTSDGWRWVDVQFRDGKGYVTTAWNIYDGIYLDRTPPTGSIIINSGNPTYTTSTSVTLYLTYSDATSGVDKVRYQNDGGTWTAWMSPSSTKAWTLSAVDGTRTVYYQIRDKAGWICPTKSDTIILDRTPPTGSIVINLGNPTYTTTRSVTLYLTYSDATSGVDQVRYRNDGEAWTAWMSPSSTKAWTLTAGDGTKTVYYQIKDKAGWISLTYSDDIILQTPAAASIKIWTDKSVYHIGEKMNVYLRVKNPGAAPLPVRVLIALKLTDGSYYVLLDMTTTLPAGYDSGDVLWNSFTLPTVPLGNYAWVAALCKPGTYTIISLSQWNWQLSAAATMQTPLFIPLTKPE